MAHHRVECVDCHQVVDMPSSDAEEPGWHKGCLHVLPGMFDNLEDRLVALEDATNRLHERLAALRADHNILLHRVEDLELAEDERKRQARQPSSDAEPPALTYQSDPRHWDQERWRHWVFERLAALEPESQRDLRARVTQLEVKAGKPSPPSSSGEDYSVTVSGLSRTQCESLRASLQGTMVAWPTATMASSKSPRFMPGE